MYLKDMSKSNIYTLGYAYFLTNTVEPNVLNIFDLNDKKVKRRVKLFDIVIVFNFRLTIVKIAGTHEHISISSSFAND